MAGAASDEPGAPVLVAVGIQPAVGDASGQAEVVQEPEQPLLVGASGRLGPGDVACAVEVGLAQDIGDVGEVLTGEVDVDVPGAGQLQGASEAGEEPCLQVGLLGEALPDGLVACPALVRGEPGVVPVPAHASYQGRRGQEVELLVALVASCRGRDEVVGEVLQGGPSSGGAGGAVEGGAEVETEGAGLDEGGPVGGVLDGVGEDEGLLLLVGQVGGAEGLGQGDGQEGGGGCAHEADGVPGAAGRAGVAPRVVPGQGLVDGDEALVGLGLLQGGAQEAGTRGVEEVSAFRVGGAHEVAQTGVVGRGDARLPDGQVVGVQGALGVALGGARPQGGPAGGAAGAAVDGGEEGGAFLLHGGGGPPGERGLGGDLPQESVDVTDPELDLDVNEGTEASCGRILCAGVGGEGEEAAEGADADPAGGGVGGVPGTHGRPPQGHEGLIDGNGARAQDPQEGLAYGVPGEPLAQCDGVGEVVGGGPAVVGDEDGLGQTPPASGVRGGADGGDVTRVREDPGGVLPRPGEGLVGGETVLGNDAVRLEGASEDGPGEVPHRGGGRVGAARIGAAVRGARGGEVAQGRGGGDGDDVPQGPPRPGDAQGGAEAAQEHGDVGALGAVVGVELVQDEVLQILPGAAPQVRVTGVHEEQVEHLVVGEQDMGRVGTQGVPVVNDVLGTHDAVVPVTADVEADAHPVQLGGAAHGPGDTTGLVGGQGVHGVEDDGGNAAGAPAVGAARVVQQGQEEGLGLAASGAGGHERGPWCMVAAAQALEGAGLVQVGGEPGGHPAQGAGPGGGNAAEGRAQPQVGAAEDAVLGGVEEGGQDVARGRIGQGVRGGQVLHEPGADVLCQEARQAGSEGGVPAPGRCMGAHCQPPAGWGPGDGHCPESVQGQVRESNVLRRASEAVSARLYVSLIQRATSRLETMAAPAARSVRVASPTDAPVVQVSSTTRT